MFDSLQPHGLYSSWNSPGQNTGAGSLSLLQKILPTQGFNPGLLHCRQILYHLSHQESLCVEKSVSMGPRFPSHPSTNVHMPLGISFHYPETQVPHLYKGALNKWFQKHLPALLWYQQSWFYSFIKCQTLAEYVPFCHRAGATFVAVCEGVSHYSWRKHLPFCAFDWQLAFVGSDIH